MDKILQKNNIRVFGKHFVEKIEGEKDTVTHLVLKSGKKIPADLLIYGIGSYPNTDFVPSDLVGKKGIKVNNYLKTKNSNIYAAGDVTEFEGGVNI